MQDGFSGLGWSLMGTFVGMMLLLVLRNVGGMGAGDVKLLAGVGAWLGTVVTLYAFAATAIVGGIMAAFMILKSGQWEKHWAMAHQILHEWKTVRNPEKLAKIARERKPTMYLLPYGIPMAIGSIAYFALPACWSESRRFAGDRTVSNLNDWAIRRDLRRPRRSYG